MAGRSVQSNVVIRINDREITNSYRGIGAEVSRLQRELRGMTVGSEEYIRTSQQLRTVRARFQEVRDEINGTRRDTESLFQIFAGNVAANFFENATSKAMEWGQQLAKRVEDLVKIKSALSTLDSDLKGADLNKATASVQAIVDTYEKSAEEIQSAIKGMNVLTGDTEKSLKLIVDGFDSGADASGEMLAQIKEYAPMMKDAKVSAEQMMAIIAQTEKMGVYDDKGIDVVKEGMLRVREGTKGTKDAMRALGIDVDATYKKIAAGTISYFDVLQTVSAKIADVGADSRITGTAIADIFGGPGEDAGYQYLSQLKDINTNLDTLVVSTNETAIAKKAEFEANEKLNNIWVNLTGTASVLSIAYSKVKSALADMLSIIFDLENEDPSEEYLRMAQKLRHLKETILAVIAVMASYRAGLVLTTLLTRGAWQQTLLYNAVQKAKVIGETVARASTLLYAAAKAILTGNIARATAAMRVFNTTTKLNPLGFLLSLLTAAVAAFVIFRNRVKEAREEIAVLSREQRLNMEMQKGMSKQVLQDVQELKRKIDPLIKTLNDQNKTLQQRKDAYEQLVKIAPEFRGTVDKEYYATLKLSEAYGTLINRITNLAKKRALESLTSEKQSALIREEAKMDMLASEREENIYKMTGVFPGKTWIKDPDFKQLSVVESNVLANRNKVLTLQISASSKKAESLQKDIDDLNSTIEKRYANVFDDDKKKGGSKDFDFDKAAEDEKKKKQAEKDRLKAEKDRKKELEEIEKAEKESHERLIKLQEEYQTSKSEVIEDEFQKETQKEVDRRNQEEANFEKQIVELQNRKEKSKSKSEKVDIDKSIDLVNKINEQKEEEHKQKMLAIQQKYDAKLIQDFIENQQKVNNEKRVIREQEINEITTYEDFKQKLSQKGFLKLSDAELNGVKNLEDAKKALRRKADQELLKAQLITLQKTKEMLTSQLEFVSGDLKKQMLQDLAKVSEEIAKIVGDLQGTSGDLKNPKEEIDILGFTAKQWDDVFNNLENLSGAIAGIGTAFQALGNAATMYGDLQRALGERELKSFTKIQDSKKNELDKKLALGLISQENYTKETELLDAQLANKQAEIEYKQAKADKMSKLFSAVGATALGVANALSMGLPGIAIAAIVGALGAIQIATIAAQPLPELQSYADGGFFEGYTGESNLPIDETGERPVGLVKLHRREWTAPRWMTEHPVISKDIQRLEFMRANKITSLAEGGYPEKNTTASSTSSASSSSENSTAFYAIATKLLNILQKIDDDGGLEAFIVENPANEKKMRRMVKNRENLENKNKR
ncbi:phage tail tape measure protein [Chryseobacterium sp. YIM B08800]|uniref:phage tail tape measure protein n=1 Tax=Chryseobacterium sp. YIM B08800 TaxID=2984136 RepID=UPI00223EF594|nr:phage tail tape measure protein [Chryseobacterium sp. YIM B08800]